MKICPSCKETKDVAMFGKDKHRPDGLTSACKDCRKISMATWTANNKEYYAKKHIEWKAKNPKAWAAHKSKDYFKHREKRLATDKRRKQETHYAARYEAARIKIDPQFRLVKIIRKRFNSALKGKIKSGSAITSLGCSLEYFAEQIKKKFQPGMTEENHGFGDDKWHYDHIIPLDYFDLEDPFQFKMAANYLNYQPMWQKDNHAKHASLPINFKDQLAVLYHIVERNNSELSTMFPNPAYDSLPAAA